MLKCQFHSHAKGDPVDHINYTPEELINRAYLLKYDVLCISCHRKILFSKDLKKYAATKNILLIPSIEFEINKKHILCINVTKEILEADSFEKLRKYKKENPECLIIAPHPFFPNKKTCLKDDLIKNIDLFDAIEYSFAYTRTINFNKKAEKTAKQYKKPLIATADCHILSYLDIGYTFVEATKDIPSIVHAIRKDKVKMYTKPTSYHKILRLFAQIGWQNLFKR